MHHQSTARSGECAFLGRGPSALRCLVAVRVVGSTWPLAMRSHAAMNTASALNSRLSVTATLDGGRDTDEMHGRKP